MIRQRTLKQVIEAVGIGLHSGNKVQLVLRPAPANTGIVFRRTDLEPVVDIPARAELVRETTLCTALVTDEGVRISTVEHLMAALAGMGIDNAIVEVDAPEIPIMDGSASPFVYLLQQAGIEEQQASKRFIRITKTIRIEDGDKWAEFSPYNGFRIDFSIDFAHPAIDSDTQHKELDLSACNFVQEISRARTFGFMRDIEYLQANNLALGGSLDNAIVLDEYKILNDGGLRYRDEFVKHKILDAIGDLYMAGHSIVGEVKAYKSGHALNNMLIRELLAHPEAWEYVSYEQQDSPISYQVPSLA
ncbi:UDP-3-O-acyl-N-acetylglucosamine deacetylase [Echinimonas agarilytica]|uniref:UDP-3-O-acyl-N-acetylglucosamine deacetylase n=1 Tax=Echinimonas agarilytica TaxID=1215918 RepID=A0AA41W533_9GAMM|nr:UDP-3-O-acyl-N-acetylglucosamine deacetylase [Echinimonas agarilytica]MCM2678785.1 UDP-3-O-acyl-N-acetylglucosamine deacetylase [Echinimonas agarilytica]